MYFKQIEMTGFKSFADRTAIRLEPGVTAVVGPNGCGKSNILDAVRWVLGEQSPKALRGTHMQDVIFNGSESRHATGMAEVSLTFDNADSRLPLDFAEVEVSRRVYRSGESEYLINKAPCRLRDIHELFMDTGIGTNAYSLIGQGKIAMVLSSKPEDRRFVFEEAAGIIKYKTRKQVAMRRLENAGQNILRLGDIVAEVQHQMRRLKRQVNAAIRHRELTAALRELEIRAAWLKHRRLTAEIKTLRQEFAKARDAYEKAAGETSTLDARREELGLSRLELERALEERREGVRELDAEMEKIERSIALLRQQVAFSQEQQQQAVRESEEFEKRAEAVALQLAESDAQAQASRRHVEAQQDALDQKQQEHTQRARRVSEADAHSESVRNRVLEAMNARAKTQTELETIEVSIRNIETQLQGISQNQESFGRRKEQLLGRLQELRQAEAEKQSALDGVLQQHGRWADVHAEKGRAMRAVNDEWQQLREQKSRVEARLHSLRELRDKYEGFAAGVRAIMSAKQKQTADIRGIIGPAGDLLSTDKTYERAIEAALGGNINNIVVETADDAKSAIAFLNQHRAGRVTFLPLDTIRCGVRDDMDAVRGLPGVIGPAIEYVHYDPRIRVAVEYLLYNTVVVQTIDDAIRIARSPNPFPRLVTLEGEVVASSGAVTGGRTQHESRGLLGRSAEIAELEEKVLQTDAGLEELAKMGQGLAEEISDLERHIKEEENRERELRRELNELGVVIARHTTELENLSDASRQLAEQRDDLCARRNSLDVQRREAQERISLFETDDEALQRAVAEAQENASRVRQDLSLCTDELADLRVKLAELTRSAEEITRNKERELREREEALREAGRRRELAAKHKENEATLEQEIARHVERSSVLSGEKDVAQQNVVEVQNQLQTVLDETDRLDKALRSLHEQTHAAQAEVHKQEMALRHLEDQCAFFEERILSEYRVALASLKEKEVGTDEYDDETREQIVADYREKLERLGEVNMMAIEEYEALEKRNDFLVSQLEDITKAREVLLGVVTRIDKTIREMFLTTFERVGDSFRNYFRRLFNGGQARIYLLDEDDPLESGIEIEARPPGKKPQSIQLLSGGEQALTAIALLFSILKAKPSPFCVLDEVDAPLDDTNIARFLSLVDEFIDESQFIVITHSKQTMSKADVLYGVTMQERGVSQLVSVKFDQMKDVEIPA